MAFPRSDRSGAAARCGGPTSDGYYEQDREVSIIPERQPTSADAAHRCWTGAMRTSENSGKEKFRELPS
jgi:hypothetical protein